MWGFVVLVVWLVRLPIPDDQPFKELFIAAPAGTSRWSRLHLSLRGTPDSFEPVRYCVNVTSPIPALPNKWIIFARRERWGLSWRGWVLMFVVILSVGWIALLYIYPFLAVTHRVNANVLVVEGWVHEYAIRAAVKEFRNNRYERVCERGGPVERNRR